MPTKNKFARALFSIVFSCALFFYMLHFNFNAPLLTFTFSFGVSCLIGFGFFMLSKSFKDTTLKQLNTITIGLFFGCLLANALTTVFSSIGSLIPLNSVFITHSFELLKIILFLSGVYLGLIFTLKQADNFALCIPFVNLTEKKEYPPKLILDQGIVNDARFIDLCSTGLFAIELVLPKFLIEKIYAEAEIGDDKNKMIARKSLEHISQLQNLDTINLTIDGTKIKNTLNIEKRTLQLAEKYNANILTSQENLCEAYSKATNTKIISLQQIMTILKPTVPTGDVVTIKVQRYGKEARQGVGYLDDSTMVVINNGGDFIGETIDAQVISVKQTSAGRIIFTNAIMNPEHDPIINSVMYD
jgi:uncharacterized protein YacL